MSSPGEQSARVTSESCISAAHTDSNVAIRNSTWCLGLIPAQWVIIVESHPDDSSPQG